MPRKAYTLQEKAEAVEIARVLGSNTAAAQLGIDQRTIRGWMANSGDPDAITVPVGEFEEIRALAVARAKSMLASGKMTLSQVMTAAGIAEDKIAKAADRAARAEPLDPDALHLERIRREHGQPGVDFLTSCIRLSLRRQRIGPDPDGPSSPEIVAAIDDWELGCIRIALEDYGDLVTAKAAVDAELDRLAVLDAIALDEQLARNAESRARWEAESLIRRAEAYLAQPQPEARA